MLLTDEYKQWMSEALANAETRLRVEFNNLERLVTDRSESLEREMHAGFDETHSRSDTSGAPGTARGTALNRGPQT